MKKRFCSSSACVRVFETGGGGGHAAVGMERSGERGA